MKIKTLAEILAESDTDSAELSVSKRKTSSNKKLNFNKTASSETKSTFSTDNDNNEYATKTKENYHTSDLSESSDDDDSFYTSNYSERKSKNSSQRDKKRKKRFHPAAHFTAEPTNAPAYHPPTAQSIKEILAEVKNDSNTYSENSTNPNPKANSQNQPVDLAANNHVDNNDNFDVNSDTNKENLPSALKAYLRTPEQRQADIDEVKAESRLRWLAFYYLSRREYGKAELRQKLIDKEQNPEKIEALLDEFEEKGYQSDYRTTLMLIRESIRKGRGRGHIKQEFYRKKIDLPSNIDELIDMANEESDEFREFVDDDEDSLIEGVDWLKLAVTARTKKYGNTIPSEQKDKGRQLRFLQYRGFDMDICFQALNYTLDTLDERF